MGFSAAVIGGGMLIGASQQRKMRKAAEEAARKERQAVEAMQREIQAEAEQPDKAMPTPDDDASRRAKRRSLSSFSRRRGRQSTILTGDVAGDTLG